VQEAFGVRRRDHVDEAEIGRAAAQEVEIIRRRGGGIGAHAVQLFTDLGEEEQDHVGEILRSDIIPSDIRRSRSTPFIIASRQVGGDPWP
jgi:hypothetical protein